MPKILDFILSAVCISIPIGILVFAAIYGIRMRMREADRLWAELARQTREDVGLPKNRSQARQLAVFAIIGIIAAGIGYLLERKDVRQR